MAKAKHNDQLPAPLQWCRAQAGEEFEVRWLVAGNETEAKKLAKVRLAQFISQHWELPAGNDRGPETIREIGDHMSGQNPTVTAKILQSYVGLVEEMGPV